MRSSNGWPRIKRKHDAGRRVYFRYLGETLQLFCRNTALTQVVESIQPERNGKGNKRTVTESERIESGKDVI